MICVLNFKNKISIAKQQKMIKHLDSIKRKDTLLVAPTFIEKNNYKNLDIISQNISIKKRCVGENSPDLLHFLNIDYSIIGHLERRLSDLETMETIKNRIENALINGITPIICIGITNSINDLEKELNFFLADIDFNNKNIVIAYEDIESTINSERSYTDDEIKKIFEFLKSYFINIQNNNFNFNYKILFGGSVTKNEISILKLIGYDGILLGDRYGEAESIVNLLDYWNNQE